MKILKTDEKDTEGLFTEEALLDALPHGSGIDCKWELEETTTGRLGVACTNSFHYMDENGMYDGWQDFKVFIFRHKKDVLHALKGPMEGKFQVIARKGDLDFVLTFPDTNSAGYHKIERHDLRSYLNELFNHALEGLFTLHSTKENNVTETKKAITRSRS